MSVRPLIILVAVALSSPICHLGLGAEKEPRSANQTASTIKELQGTWVGTTANDLNGSEVSIVIKGDSFRFHRDADFWFETTIALRQDTLPQQLLATIVRSARSQGSSVGKVVPAIFKIEEGTMTIGAFAEIEDPPEGFQDIDDANLYVLRLVPTQVVEGPIPK